MAKETVTNVSRVQNIPGFNVHTMRIAELLRQKSEKGTVLTDEEVSATIGMSVGPKGSGYGYLRSAMRLVSKEKRVNWSRMRGAKAIKCLSDGESVEDAEHARKSIHRKSKRVLQALERVDVDNLDDAKKSQHLLIVAQVGTLTAFSDSDTTKQLAARNCTKVLDVGSVFDLMKQ